MASAPEPQYEMPWNKYPPYINPYQSFPNPMNVQVESKIQVPFQILNIFESRQSILGTQQPVIKFLPMLTSI